MARESNGVTEDSLRSPAPAYPACPARQPVVTALVSFLLAPVALHAEPSWEQNIHTVLHVALSLQNTGGPSSSKKNLLYFSLLQLYNIPPNGHTVVYLTSPVAGHCSCFRHDRWK